MSNAVLTDDFEGSIIVRFNRPEIRNPLSIEVLEQVLRITDCIGKRHDVKKLIFTGVGSVFASGANLREIAEVDEAGSREFALRGQRLMRRISDIQPTTIAAVNGICFGGALDLALACQRRIASPEALFSHPGADLGIMTGWGGTQRLPRVIGEAKAFEMFFSAKRVTAEEALRIGLVDEIAHDPVASALQLLT